jgi:hypothetical protein
MKTRLVFGLVIIAVLLGVGAATSLADPNLTDVRPHRHWINGVQVGPRVCDNPNLQEAFNQFHNNLHVSSGFGPAAPGLHNGQGGEITATGC